jgi:hypothetical protein
MTALARKIAAEKWMREWLEENGLPEPDFVEYGITCIRLFFNGIKHIVVLELDETEEADACGEGDVA